MGLIAFAAKTGASIAAEKIVSKKLDEKKQVDEDKKRNAENLRNAQLKADMKRDQLGLADEKSSGSDMKQRMFGNEKDKFSKALENKGKKQPSSFEQVVRAQNQDLQNQVDGRGLHGRNPESDNQADY